ncbi:J domain-containing protein [Caenimonas sedimenti]|uniref:J domain-containing protein n=1 Tax=Caenimonas sedimenti TaxID=2596921 RepID=A0A562ZMT5_9BURK|nr:J domain-containing protein [Caenimonas sedimenti]TWO69899.1 J domain-containing protein [Caenimonas sedimenti]
MAHSQSWQPANPTYYDVLQVERHATPERVRTAYRRLAQKYHPDKMPGNANAVRAMSAINAAYAVLSDAERRAEHDRWIQRAERPSRPMPLASGHESAWTFFNPVTGWPWYLLFGTMLLALGTIVTALYLTAMPARATAVAPALAHTAQPCQPSGTADCRKP